MSEIDILAILNSHFKRKADDVDIDEASWGDKGNGKRNYSPRDMQLAVFSRRLSALEPNHPMYEFVYKFVAELTQMSTEDKLFFWKCTIEGKKYGGWASIHKVIYCLERT